MSYSLLADIKSRLRITGTSLDGVIQSNIDTALLDMEDAGISTLSLDDKIKKGIELYCKWQMNFHGEADRFGDAYQKLCDTMEKQIAHRLGEWQ